MLCLIIVIFSLIFFVPGFEGIKRFIELTLVGRLEVEGVPPQVIAVYLENSPCDEPGGNLRSVNANANDFRPIRFNATVYDINGDCDGNATFYICANETAVSPTFCNEYYYVDSPIIVTAPYEKSGLYCNYTTTYNLPYFRRCGNWYVNVTAFDASGKSNSTVRWWRDNLLNAVLYPYVNGYIGDVVYMGTVKLGQWNTEKGRNTTKNAGNTNISSLAWNATNFTRTQPPNDVIPIIPFEGHTTFAIDNDTDKNNGAGYISEIPSSQIPFPSYGLDRCEDFNCNSAKAMYDLWWHIYVPSAIKSGIYENAIQYNSTPMSCD
ncbi:MAG: hypothetical protein NTW30_05505 [Candidatus Aenigmarchaeota archaeon]|nr:hypothetical protein [Candidatus Aenigmarchaeota archaeon]